MAAIVAARPARAAAAVRGLPERTKSRLNHQYITIVNHPVKGVVASIEPTNFDWESP
jgi:hypothetical protein